MKLVLILILCIFIVSLGILLTNNTHEGFTSKNKQIKFLNSSQACKLINDIDYFKNMTDIDISARKFIKGRKQIISSYCNNFLNFTEKDKNIIKIAIKKLPNNELFNLWSFAKIDTMVENGYPHTHKDTIFLSENTINENISRLLYVLVHEQMHVIQRKKPELFRSLFTKYFTFNIGKLIIKDKYKKLMRSNPDTRYIYENDYVYRDANNNYYYLCALYNDKNPLDLGDVKYVGIDCTYNRNDNTYTTTNIIKNIDDITGFSDYFNLTNNHYHPNEISAELIAIYYTQPDIEKTNALNNTELWLKENVV